MYPVKI